MRGGLSYAVILVGAVLGAITGTVAASVIAMGIISLPVMTRYGLPATARASLALYNTERELDALADALENAKGLLS